VDVAVLKIGINENWNHTAFPLESCANEKTLAENGYTVEHGDQVFFSGLLWHHQGKSKNVPVVRVGNVAAVRDEPVPTKSGLIDAFLIDAHSIGGFSGSPVFVDTLQAKREREVTTSPLLTPSRFLLLGLVRGHYDEPISDTEKHENVSESRSDAVEVKEEARTNTGISIVTPAEKIAEVISSFSVEESEEIEHYRKKRGSCEVLDVGCDIKPRTNATMRTTQMGIEGSKASS